MCKGWEKALWSGVSLLRGFNLSENGCVVTKDWLKRSKLEVGDQICIYWGQNPLFEEIAKQFIQSNSCILVTNEQELLEGITSILGDSGFAMQLAENAKSRVARNEVSTKTQVSYIIDKLGALH